MLTRIAIKNFVIVDELELEFAGGMTTLTGETGAGKSILIDALGLVLGDRADAGMVRAGCDKADISAAFALDARSREWLADAEIDIDEDELLLRRVVGADGRSRGWVNGSPASISSLRSLAETLVEIHGQHAHQHLLKAGRQRELVDWFLPKNSALSDVAEKAKQWRAVKRELAKLVGETGDSDGHEQRLDLLRYQLTELDDLALTAAGYEQLNSEYDQLAHGEQVLEFAQRGYDLLDGDEDNTITSQLEQVQQLVINASKYAPELSDVQEALSGAMVQLQEASVQLRRLTESLEPDPQRLQQMNSQLERIHDLARKHRIEAEQLPERHESLSNELSALENSDAEVLRLRAEQSKLVAEWQTAADRLHAGRQKAAKSLSKSMTDGIAELGMPHGKCEAVITALPPGVPQTHGSDKIEFLISANPGQPMQPLNKVASGGELARVSLAIQVAVAEAAHPGCMIFDEVDTGIGGAVAEMVGRKLRQLGEHFQVLCVTHLAPVAAQGQQQLQVHKQTDGSATSTTIVPLQGAQRVDELARMLGGVEITKQTRSHAAEMLRKSGNG